MSYVIFFLRRIKKIEEISKRKDKAHEDYLEKLESLGGSDIRSDLKRFFDFTNTYRNTVKKELAEADTIIKKGLNDKRHPLHKKQQFRKILNTDYPKLIKSFHEEDERLKKDLQNYSIRQSRKRINNYGERKK